MTRADIEHLLTQTHSEYLGDAAPPVAVPPTEPAPVSSVKPPDVPPASSSRPQPLSGGSLAIIFAILLIGLAIAFSLKQGYFPQRSDRRVAQDIRSIPKPADSVQNSQKDTTDDQSAPPFQPTTVPPGELPPEAAVSSQITTPHPVRKAAVHPVLQTSSNFEAEERLADLRADGNAKAHIKSVRKHGSVSYQVLAR
jgi:hypothetical protein